MAGESVFDHPFLWGSKRTGPDLARVGQRYSDDWHRIHLRDPRMVVPESNMPSYAWLSKTPLDNHDIEAKMRVLRKLGVPYTDAQIAGAREQLAGKTEEDAVVAYLQAWAWNCATCAMWPGFRLPPPPRSKPWPC